MKKSNSMPNIGTDVIFISEIISSQTETENIANFEKPFLETPLTKNNTEQDQDQIQNKQLNNSDLQIKNFESQFSEKKRNCLRIDILNELVQGNNKFQIILLSLLCLVLVCCGHLKIYSILQIDHSNKIRIINNSQNEMNDSINKTTMMKFISTETLSIEIYNLILSSLMLLILFFSFQKLPKYSLIKIFLVSFYVISFIMLFTENLLTKILMDIFLNIQLMGLLIVSIIFLREITSKRFYSSYFALTIISFLIGCISNFFVNTLFPKSSTIVNTVFQIIFLFSSIILINRVGLTCHETKISEKNFINNIQTFFLTIAEINKSPLQNKDIDNIFKLPVIELIQLRTKLFYSEYSVFIILNQISNLLSDQFNSFTNSSFMNNLNSKQSDYDEGNSWSLGLTYKEQMESRRGSFIDEINDSLNGFQYDNPYSESLYTGEYSFSSLGNIDTSIIATEIVSKNDNIKLINNIHSNFLYADSSYKINLQKIKSKENKLDENKECGSLKISHKQRFSFNWNKNELNKPSFKEIIKKKNENGLSESTMSHEKSHHNIHLINNQTIEVNEIAQINQNQYEIKEYKIENKLSSSDLSRWQKIKNYLEFHKNRYQTVFYLDVFVSLFLAFSSIFLMNDFVLKTQLDISAEKMIVVFFSLSTFGLVLNGLFEFCFDLLNWRVIRSIVLCLLLTFITSDVINLSPMVHVVFLLLFVFLVGSIFSFDYDSDYLISLKPTFQIRNITILIFLLNLSIGICQGLWRDQFIFVLLFVSIFHVLLVSFINLKDNYD